MKSEEEIRENKEAWERELKASISSERAGLTREIHAKVETLEWVLNEDK